MDAFYAEGNRFLQSLETHLRKLNLDLSTYELDHLCYRVTTIEEYRSWKAQLCLVGQILHEAMIGGRPIASFKLKRPISGASRNVYIIELPAPKKSSPYSTGFEHAEFVVTGDLKKFAQSYAGLSFVYDGLDKVHNPELKLSLAPGLNIKFHQTSLENLVQQESKPAT